MRRKEDRILEEDIDSHDAWEDHMVRLEDELNFRTTDDESSENLNLPKLGRPKSSSRNVPVIKGSEESFEIYAVPASINLRDWQVDICNNHSSKRMLLITNSSDRPHPIIIKKPMTNRFKLFPPKDRASPWSTVLQPGESLPLTVVFVPPGSGVDDSSEAASAELLWDNYQDIIVCFTRHYPITVPLRAVRYGSTAGDETFTPVSEALRIPPRPSTSIFDLVVSGQTGYKSKPTPVPAVASTAHLPTSTVTFSEATSVPTTSTSIAETVSEEVVSSKREIVESPELPESDELKSSRGLSVPVESRDDSATKTLNLSVVRVDSKMSAAAIIRSMRAKRSTDQAVGKSFVPLDAGASTTSITSDAKSSVAEAAAQVLDFQHKAVMQATVTKHAIKDGAPDPAAEELAFYRNHIKDSKRKGATIDGELSPEMAGSPKWRALEDTKNNLAPITSLDRSTFPRTVIKPARVVSRSGIRPSPKVEEEIARKDVYLEDSEPEDAPGRRSLVSDLPVVETTLDELDFYKSLMTPSMSRVPLKEADIYANLMKMSKMPEIKTYPSDIEAPRSSGLTAAPSKPAESTQTVEQWLQSIGMAKYTNLFLNEGLDDISYLVSISESDLHALGVRDEKDRMHIMESIEMPGGESGADDLPPDALPVLMNVSSSSTPHPPAASKRDEIGRRKHDSDSSDSEVDIPASHSDRLEDSEDGVTDEEWAKAEYQRRLLLAASSSKHPVHALSSDKDLPKKARITSIKPGQRIRVHRTSKAAKK